MRTVIGRKRCFVFLIVAFCLFGLAGCDDETKQDKDPTPSVAPTVTVTSEPVTVTPSANPTPTEAEVDDAKKKENDIAKIQTIMLAAEKVALDPQLRVPAGVFFDLRFDSGSVELMYRAFSANRYEECDYSALKSWLLQSDVSVDYGEYVLSSPELQTSLEGRIRGTVLNSGEIWWESIGMDEKALSGIDVLILNYPVHKQGEKKIVTFWTTAVDFDVYHEPYVQAFSELSAKYPDVEFLWTAEDANASRLRSAILGDSLPDIIFTWNSVRSQLVEQGCVYALDDAGAAYQSELYDVVKSVNQVDGKTYLIPTNSDFMAFFAKLDLFSECKIEQMPATYEELLDCCERLKNAGVAPIVCGRGEGNEWRIGRLFQSILQKISGSKPMNDYLASEYTFEKEDVVKAVQIFREMVEKGYVVLPDDFAKKYEEDQWGISFDGTWTCTNPGYSLSTIAVFEFPVLNPEKSSAGQYIGGPNQGFVVYNKAYDVDEKVKYAYEFVQLVNQQVNEVALMPTFKTEIRDDVGILKATTDMLSAGKSFSGALDEICDQEDYLALINALTSGKLSDEKIAVVFEGICNN